MVLRENNFAYIGTKKEAPGGDEPCKDLLHGDTYYITNSNKEVNSNAYAAYT